jgi:predicted kinase
MLIVFGGLPGTGKTTLARALAQELHATYLRIDTIEHTLRSSGVLSAEVGPSGYLIAYALTDENLRTGQIVVADSVNRITATREAWRQVAERTRSEIVEIEVICSDPIEHRARVENRDRDAGQSIPLTWQAVIERHYDPWDRPHITIDTARRTIESAFGELRSQISSAGGQ